MSASSATRRPARLSTSEESLYAAARLLHALQQGWRPPALVTRDIALGTDEQVYARVHVERWEYYAQNVRYNSGFLVLFGGFFSFAFSLMGSLLFHQWQKGKAQRQAVAQWRPIDVGMLYLTNQRFAIMGQQGWLDIPYAAIRASECDGWGIVLRLDQTQPIRLRTAVPDCLFAVFRFLAYGEITQPYEQSRLTGGSPLEGPPELALESASLAPLPKADKRSSPRGIMHRRQRVFIYDLATIEGLVYLFGGWRSVAGFFGLSLAISAVYFIGSWTLFGRTLWMTVYPRANLRVISETDGGNPSLIASTRRYLMLIASMIFPIEFLVAYVNPHYRFLHDRFAKTDVVRSDRAERESGGA